MAAKTTVFIVGLAVIVTIVVVLGLSTASSETLAANPCPG